MTSTERLSGALSDRYRIERELGAGGMATVFLARDLRHEREVAIKVLHPELGAALGADRFLSEIKTTAKLQHPHILPLLDSGSADGLLYYVMPLATGETLRAKLTRERQLSIEDTLRIAREAADALGHAHAAGIVHRDIKPENILLQGGHAVVADFGIALAVQQAGGQRMTQTGLSLGTPQYMSPEQAMGERAIDTRSDIYALGAVTYEMLTGDPPFTGSSVQAIVAKVLTEKPSPPSTVRDTVPPGVESAVLKALAKLPADRFASAADFASALADLSDRAAGATRTPGIATRRDRWRDPFVLGLGTVAVALAIALASVVRRSPTDADAFPVRTEITVAAEPAQRGPTNQPRDITPRGSATLSPDGHSVAFVGPALDGTGWAIHVRRLDQLTSRIIPGTPNPQSPSFSPDGKWIALTTLRRRIIKVPVDGGAAVTLSEVGDDGGMDWSPRGDIIFGYGVMEGLKGLQRVNSMSGGALQPFTVIDSSRKELSHQYPRVLPDEKTVLFTIWYGASETSEIGAASLDDGKVTRLGVLGAKPLGVVDGKLVYVRRDGAIMAVPFDVKGRTVSGTATLVQDSVRLVDAGDASAFMTHAGGLVYARGGLQRRLVWVDRSGTVKPALGDEREYVFVRLSPDGRQVAVNINSGPKSDIWLVDVATGTLTPLTNSGSARNPVWSADGKRILFVSTQGGRSAFWWQPADGSGPAIKVKDAPHNPWWIDLAPGERSVVFNAIYDGTFNLESFALDSANERRDISASPAAVETTGRISPDGKWVAYMSDESGRAEVYVRSYPGGGSRVQISVAGGFRPVWSRDGNVLYHWEQNRFIAVNLAREPALRVVSRQALFAGNFERDFDVSADGSRFLMIEERGSDMSLIVIPNWLTELRRLTSTASK
ncbi:MAG: protein kinase domain-containing protein [Gemmatimonadaceae bacterium]